MWAQVCFFRMKPGTKILMHSGGCNARLNLSLGLLGCSIAERAGGVGRVGRSKPCKLKLHKFRFGVSSVESCLKKSSIYRSTMTCFRELCGPCHCMGHFMHLLFHDLAMVQGQVIDKRWPQLLNPQSNMSLLRLQRLIHPSRRRRAPVAEWTAAGI